jgi:hypothetical protein
METSDISKIVATSVIIGVVITLITGIIPNIPTQLVGASWYGLPIKWLIKLVIAPQYNPWKVLPVNLFEDLVFWVVVTAIVMTIARKLKKSGNSKKK